MPYDPTLSVEGAEADAADAALRAAGVIVRKVKGYGLPQCLRITVGDEEANRVLIDTLSAFRKGQGK